MKLGLSLLGEIEIYLDGHLVVNLRSEKARALLFFIVIESDTFHRRDALAELFWPEKPPGYGRNSLKQAIAILRKALNDQDLKEPILLTSSQDLHFNAGSAHWVDALEFEKIISAVHLHKHQNLETCDDCARELDQAATLYRDDFLAGFYLPDCQEFDEWMITKREYFKRMMAEVLRNLITYQEGKQEYKKASEYAVRLVALEPWSESSHRLLMRLLALGGKRSAALKQYHACVQILESELGVSPTEETISLFEQIKEWKFEDGLEKKYQTPIEQEKPISKRIKPTELATQQLKPWIMSSAILSFMVLVGLIFTAMKKGDQQALPALLLSGSITNPPNSSGAIEEDGTPTEGPTASLQNIKGEETPQRTMTVGITDSIEPGENLMTDNLGQDQYVLSPSQACLPEERLLYLEDFQDNQAQGWPEIEFHAQGWDLTQHPDSTINKVIQFPGETDSSIQLRGLTFEDSVWRIYFMPKGRPNYINFDWHINKYLDPWQMYTIGFTEGNIGIIRGPGTDPEIVLLNIEGIFLKQDVWHLLEISSYNATQEVWLDGTQLLRYVDPQPLPDGQIGLGILASEYEDSIVFFDNLSVCELSKSFVSILSQDP